MARELGLDNAAFPDAAGVGVLQLALEKLEEEKVWSSVSSFVAHLGPFSKGGGALAARGSLTRLRERSPWPGGRDRPAALHRSGPSRREPGPREDLQGGGEASSAARQSRRAVGCRDRGGSARGSVSAADDETALRDPLDPVFTNVFKACFHLFWVRFHMIS